MWHEPQYKIEEFGTKIDKIKSIIENELNCQTDMPYYKNPNPNTILGRIHPTFRFEFIKFADQVLDSIIDHLNLGFGQNGYYYDINIREIDCSKEKWEEISQNVIQISGLIEETFETKFISYSYPHDNQNKFGSNPFWEIPNFDLTFVDKDRIIYKQFPELKSLVGKIQKNHEPIIKNHENLIFPALQFNIDSKLRHSNPVLFQRSEKYLENGRHLAIRLVDATENAWNISSRGVHFEFLFEYIKEFFMDVQF
ncbi:MAG: hypothetical protein ACTSUI_02930 [Promethearchaeota archaeon]